MKVVEENNFMKFVEQYKDGMPLYRYLDFDYIAEWTCQTWHLGGQFGKYGFAVVRIDAAGEEEKSGTIWIGAEGSCIVYDGILYEDEGDFDKLILKLEQERVSDMLRWMEKEIVERQLEKM